MVTEIHKDLWNELGHVVRERRHTGAQSQHSSMSLDQQLGVENCCLGLLLYLGAAQFLKLGLKIQISLNEYCMLSDL